MSFVSYYTRIIVQFVIFITTKIFVLRGHVATPRISYTKGSHIIAANHRSGLDPFVIVSSLRIRDFVRLAPFSFMTANKFMQPLWLRPIAWLAGCFPAREGLGAHGVDKAVNDLHGGYTLVIFPEGRRIKDIRQPAKRGISDIMNETPNSKLILMHIEWQSAIRIQSIHVAYPQSTTSLSTPDKIMDAIYAL